MYKFTLLLIIFCCTTVHAEKGSTPSKEVPTKASESFTEPELSSGPKNLLGWSISGLSGINFCLPSGTASCSDTYPGVNLGLSTEYRWQYIGLTLNLDWGNFIPSGTGSENTSNTFGHLGLGLRYYYPYQTTQHLYIGGGFGMGEAEVSDQRSESAVQWSSWWSDVRLDLGALWFQRDHWSLESALSMIIHSGGTRCIIFQGAGPCQALSDLDTEQQSIARVLMLRFGARWIL